MCPTRGAAAVAREEARKALAAAAWTSRRDVYRIVWTLYEREISSTGRRILRVSRTVRQAATVQPFASPDPAALAERGFVDVAVERRVRLLQARGFYDRQMTGAGVFLTPQSASRAPTMLTSSGLTTVSGIPCLPAI